MSFWDDTPAGRSPAEILDSLPPGITVGVELSNGSLALAQSTYQGREGSYALFTVTNVPGVFRVNIRNIVLAGPRA